jgi:hypothetical protein
LFVAATDYYRLLVRSGLGDGLRAIAPRAVEFSTNFIAKQLKLAELVLIHLRSSG